MNHTTKLKIIRDNSPPKLAHPYLPVGWQDDNSLVIEVTIHADDNEGMIQRKADLLATTFRFSNFGGDGSEDMVIHGLFRYNISARSIGQGKTFYLDLSVK